MPSRSSSASAPSPAYHPHILLYKTRKFSILSLPPSSSPHIFLDLNCQYTQSILQSIFQKRSIPHTLGPGHGFDPILPPSNCTFQWSEYERIDWNANSKIGKSSFRLRKGLSRKAQLCHYTELYIAKNQRPNCRHLKRAMPDTIILETWSLFEKDEGDAGGSGGTTSYQEKVELCLAEVRRFMMDAEEELEENGGPPPVWILKPSTVNKGHGIKIVHCLEEVREMILDLTDIREWVVQRYITNPLLLNKRKFHIRAYVVAASTLQVYFYDTVLFLLSSIPYDKHNTSNTASHLTNTSLQSTSSQFQPQNCILLPHQFLHQLILQNPKTYPTHVHAKHQFDKILTTMKDITSTIFDIYKHEYNVFTPQRDCFELFGFDFMVDDTWNVYLLEINPGPDLKQSGNLDGKGVIEGLMEDILDVVLLKKGLWGTKFSLVYDCDLGNHHFCRNGEEKK